MPNHQIIQTLLWFSTCLAGSACSLDPHYLVDGEDGGPSSDGDADSDADSDVSAACGDPNMIDDMEDGDDTICASSARIGGWFIDNDKTDGGTQEPAPEAAVVMSKIEPARVDSRYAVHSSGRGFTRWGIVIYAKVYGGTQFKPFDVSAYSGITFSAKSTGARTIKIKVRTVDTIPEEEGGTCTEACYNSYARADIPIAADWSDYEITFAELRQEDWGPKVAFDETAFMGVEFYLPPDGTDTFDLWVDNVRLF